MSKGFGSGSSKSKINVKQFYLINKFAEGEKFYHAKNYSKAELIFSNLKDAGYEDPNLFLYLANIYILNGCDEKAIIILKKACENNSEDPNLHYNLGTIYFKKKVCRRREILSC